MPDREWKAGDRYFIEEGGKRLWGTIVGVNVADGPTDPVMAITRTGAVYVVKWDDGETTYEDRISHADEFVSGALCYDGFHTPGSVDAKNLLDSLCDNNDIHNWNDAPGRTQAEVLALFDRAIAECEAQVSMTAREGE